MIPTHNAFRQLEPLLGEKVQALEAAWLSGNPSERQEIEVVLELLRRQATDRWSALLQPPSGQEADGPIRIGRILHGRQQLGSLGIHPAEALEHTLVIGRTGAGKSSCVHAILDQLGNRGTPWLLTDNKRSARAIAGSPSGQHVQVVCVGRDFGALLQFNPLAPPRGLDPEVHVRQVVELIGETYSGGDAVANLLVGAIEACRKEVGQFPTLLEVQQHLCSRHVSGRAIGWAQTTTRILDRLTKGVLGRVLGSRRDAAALEQLRHGQTVLELDGLSRQDAAFVLQLILRYLNTTMLADPHRETLRLLVAIDEAEDLAPRRDGARETVLERMARQARETGIGLLCATQSPSALSTVVLANCYTTIALNLRSRMDVGVASSLLLLDAEGSAMLGCLPTGHAVVRLSGRWPWAVHVELPHFLIPKGKVSDQDVLARFLTGPFARRRLGNAPPPVTDSAGSARSLPNAPPDEVTPVIPPIPRVDVAVVATSSSHPTAPTDLLEEQPLCRLLLKDIAAHPFSGVAERYGRLSISRRKGNAARHALERHGYVRGLLITVPKGQLRLFELTAEGRQWCLQHRVPMAPLHGGVEHALLQHLVAAMLRRRSWTVMVEHRIGDHAFDIFAQRGDHTMLVEIETAKSTWLQNLSRLQGTAATYRCVVFTSAITLPSSLVAPAVSILLPHQFEAWFSRLDNPSPTAN